MEFQAVSATFAAKLKKGTGESPCTLFLEKFETFTPWQAS